MEVIIYLQKRKKKNLLNESHNQKHIFTHGMGQQNLFSNNLAIAYGWAIAHHERLNQCRYAMSE